jgi:uncharacterized membrane-anchored protein YhcB (DUF1043 family)
MQAAGNTSWQNPKVLTTLVLVFVAGAFSGALSMRWGLHERMHPQVTSLRNPEAAKALLDRCRKELNLTPKQANEMATVLDDYKQYYENLQDQMDEIRGTGRERIKQILTKEQQLRFEKILGEVPR